MNSTLNRFVVLPLIAGSVCLVGCVSTSKYKKLQDDMQTQQTQKDQQLSQKDQQISTLQSQVDDLQKQNTNLLQQTTTQAANEDQYHAIIMGLSDEVQKGNLKVTAYKNMLKVDVAEQIFFNSGSALIKESGQKVLTDIAANLKNYPDKIIRVVGYTDNRPLSENTQKIFASNWELSVIRAVNVVKLLQNAGIPPERLIASGRGEFAPIATNDTPEGRQKNRRIEIMLVDRSLVDSLSTK